MDFLRTLFGLPTRLETAVREGDREKVRRILDEGTTDWDGRTVGIAAVDEKAPHILEALLDAGADPDPLLRHAARRGFADMVELLIRRGAGVGCFAEALNVAVYSHHAATPEMLSTIVDRLLSGGADIDAAWRGITALMAAADLGANQAVELLLSRGGSGRTLGTRRDESGTGRDDSVNRRRCPAQK